MRRFSQKSSLVTLSEINITPLLDLAFVLLIIFIITTPLLEQGLSLQLPKGGAPDTPIDKKSVRTVEIARNGNYTYNGRTMNLQNIERQLVGDYKADPDLVVYIRTDEQGINKHTYAVIDACQRHGITRFSLRTVPPKAQ
ncbi:MAG: biopolymer transporter ExbD [Verrucomicrobia bacterium]|jgi:biopolymer transport protein ExbD|nr:biopolymer transporter ExbD [Verrucomicrobiota bacterium]